MPLARLAIAIAVALLAGCQQKESPTPDPPTGLALPVGPAASARPQLQPGDRVDVRGIVVKMLDGGAIQLTGRDRWDAPLDTMYESIEFLRNALPVLERSVTPEQATGLRALIAGRLSSGT